MKKIGLILVILIVLIGIIVLTGCSIIFTAPDCYTPPITPPTQNCYLTVTAGDYVWGTIYVDDQSTGQYIDFEGQLTTTVVVSCNIWVAIYIVDSCGNQSHTETIYISPGQNYLYFAYWKDKDKQNDFH